MKKILYSVMALAIAAMTFTACEDVPEPYPTPTPTNGNGQIEGATGDGTLENPFNAIAAANAAKELGSGNVSEQVYYIKGKVVSIATDKNGVEQNYDQGNFGNASFYISDDGTSTNQFYCYRVLYLGNKKWTAGAGDLLKVGDEVIVCAKLTLYNTTPETNQNDGYLYSLNGKTEGGSTDDGIATGDGTLANPFNAVAATNTAKALGSGNTSDKAYYIKGKVASIATDKNGNVQNFDFQTYGNATFYISDDGTSANQFYCYQVLYLGNKKWTQGAGDILKVGDDVIVCAKLTMYNTTPETQKGEGYLYSLNGKTEGSSTPDTPAGDVGSLDAPKTVAEALTVINALEEGATTSANYFVKGKVVSVATAAEDIGPNSTSGKKYKDINYYISADGSDNNTIYVYRGKNLNNTDFTSADQLKVGDEVIVYGKLQKYKDTKNNKIVPEMAQGNYLVKTSNTSSGDTPSTPDTPDTPAEAGTNGDFELWTGGTPDNWKTASSAGNATLSQSTDAHGGKFSCKVGGNASSNKRLGYKEMSLKAGSYKVTFYAKALSSGGSLNPGIVPIGSDGRPGTYAYTGYVDNISNSEWQKVEATIEVASDGTYCFVIMNQKKTTAVDILIDDFTVVKGSTSIIK